MTIRLFWRNVSSTGAVLALASLFAGCASQTPAPVIERATPVAIPSAPVAPRTEPPLDTAVYYTVKKGDTLYSIALEHGQAYRDIAAWNKLDDPNKINVGQQLRIGMATSESTAPVGVAVTRPVAAPAVVETRPLGTATAANTETLKREPKGGKLPYSEETLARLQKPVPAPAAESKQEIKPAQTEASGDKPTSPPQAVDTPLEWAWPAGGKLIGNFVDGGNKGLDIAGKAGEPVQAAAPGKVILVSSALRGYGNFVIIKHNASYLSVYAHNSRILVKEEQMVTKGQKIAEIGSSDSDQPKLHFEIRQQGKPVDPLKFLPAR